jgi:hypothetical protein
MFNDAMIVLEELAKKETDGHYTILKFTTGYQVCLGTPAVIRAEIDQGGIFFAGPTLEKAILKLASHLILHS